MVIDLNDTHAQRQLPPIKSSQYLPLSTIIEHPLDESSENSDDPTNPSTKPSGIISPPRFYTKRPKRVSTMSQYNILPKRKGSFFYSTQQE